MEKQTKRGRPGKFPKTISVHVRLEPEIFAFLVNKSIKEKNFHGGKPNVSGAIKGILKDNLK